MSQFLAKQLKIFQEVKLLAVNFLIITEKFNMQTQIQLLLLQKTMVVVEGVAQENLDPRYKYLEYFEDLFWKTG